jgi:hypothetical protein
MPFFFAEKKVDRSFVKFCSSFVKFFLAFFFPCKFSSSSLCFCFPQPPFPPPPPLLLLVLLLSLLLSSFIMGVKLWLIAQMEKGL